MIGRTEIYNFMSGLAEIIEFWIDGFHNHRINLLCINPLINIWIVLQNYSIPILFRFLWVPRMGCVVVRSS